MKLLVPAGGARLMAGLLKPAASVTWMSRGVSVAIVLPIVSRSTNGSTGGAPGTLGGLRKSAKSEERPQFTKFVVPPSSEKNATPALKNRRLVEGGGLVKRTKSSAGTYVTFPTPMGPMLPLKRPMACVISCRRTATRSLKLAKPVPMPMKPSGRSTGAEFGSVSPKAFDSLGVIQNCDLLLMLLPAGRFASVKKLGWPEFSRSVLNSEYVR